MTARRQPPRRNGSPEDSAAKSAILAAAREEFAAKGLDGARVNVIAERAGVNKQLLYYYFGNKEDLYRAALESAYCEIRLLENDLQLTDLEPQAAMATLVGFSFDYLERHPDFIGLLNHENAARGVHLRASAAIREANSPLIGLIARTLELGAAQGRFRAGVDPLELYISIAGMAYFFFSNRPTLSIIFGHDLTTRHATRHYRAHVVEMALAGLRPA